MARREVLYVDHQIEVAAPSQRGNFKYAHTEIRVIYPPQATRAEVMATLVNAYQKAEYELEDREWDE